MKNRIFVLRYWSPASEKTRKKLFLKSEIFLGADQSADFRISELRGFHARLDFRTEKLEYLEKGSQREVPQGELFSLGSYVFQWRQRSVVSKENMIVGLCFMLGIVFLFSFSYLPKTSVPDCSSRQRKIAQDTWGPSDARQEDRRFFEELQSLKKSFQSFLRQENLIKARANLLAIESKIAKENAPKECGLNKPLERMREDLGEKVILHLLSQSELKQAAEELARLRSQLKDPSLYRLLERRIVKEAKKRVWQSWRLEESRPKKAYRISKRVEKVCELIGRYENCFD